MASKQAGNNLDNEITAIINELKGANIISELMNFYSLPNSEKPPT